MRSVAALTLREMSTTYGRSPGGYFWAIAEPVAGIALLTIVFSLFLKTPPIGTNFQIYYATGLLPFLMYRELEARLSSSIRFSRQLLVYPSVVYTDALFARFLLNLMTQVLVFYLVILMIVSIFETRTSIDLSLVIYSLTMAAVLGFGVGTVNCFLMSVFPVWERLWVVLNRPLVLISGVIFQHEHVPEPWQSYLWYNPLIHVTGQMRRGFYPIYEGAYVQPMYPIAVGLTLTVIGLILLNRYNRDILNMI